MQPIELWYPYLWSGAGPERVHRDRFVIWQEWRGEDVVWTLPQLFHERRWQDRGLKILAIHGEHVDRYDVYHVGERGSVAGPWVESRFPGRTVVRVLDQWLGELLLTCPMRTSPETFDLRVPDSRMECTRSVVVTLQTQPTFWMPRALPAPAEPHASPGLRSEPAVFDRRGLPAVVPPELPDSDVLRHFPDWPTTLRPLLFPGSGLEDMYANNLMREIALSSATDIEGALTHALNASAPYLREGASTLERTLLRPLLSEHDGDPEPVLTEIEGQFGVSASSLATLERSRRWKDVARRPVRCWRAWGPIGLMFALLIERLRGRLPWTVRCERCGRLIRGTKRRRFCSRQDDLECFKHGQRDRKRRSLARRGS